jgi:hypothetical protein
MIMNTNPRIKIIKLAERERRTKVRVGKGQASAGRLGRDKARDASAIITGWVSELRRQKEQSSEAAHGFKSLFEEAA